VGWVERVNDIGGKEMTINAIIANGDRSNIPEVVGSNPTPATNF
jgi:hypothetical protein